MRYKGLVVPGLLWAAVSFNMGVVTFTTKNIAISLGTNDFLTGLLVSITLIGWFFGSMIFGYLSDRYGRKNIVIYATILHITATALMSISLNYFLFLILRFVAGMGFGMVLPVLSAWVSESAPPERRGRMVVLLDSFWTYGWIIASFLAWMYLPALEGDSWSLYYLLSLGWLIALPFAWRMEEVHVSSENVSIKEVLTYKHTIPLWLIWFAMAFGYYGMFVWLPKIFSENYPLLTSYKFIFLTYLAQIPGYFTAAYLVEKIGRKKVMFSFMLFTSLSAYLFITSNQELALMAAILLSFFDLGAWGALYAITPELYPSHVKGTGTGLASAAGRIGGILGPLIPGTLAWLTPETHAWFISFLIFTLLLLGSAFLTFALPETMKRDKNQ